MRGGDDALGPRVSEAAYVVVFTSLLRPDHEGYEAASLQMRSQVARQPGFVEFESARDGNGNGVTVSYWRDLDSIKAWRVEPSHAAIRQSGRARWYERFHVVIARIEHDYRWSRL
ncbi:antibiotic biosynthesis monooxygenase family protein [Pseudomarimonas arenosa]|uniref:Antibiotic biosynthesis monooxygenase n=1 Tax=Pseudomarimonas arenosa TaxID=2774145 RepID=A0AAW3ZFM5_9GAMM|nr:antibiotic biosynthesis monooxygenase [Pseudomarimonas arenosa]